MPYYWNQYINTLHLSRFWLANDSLHVQANRLHVMGVFVDPICLCGTGSSDDMSQRQILKPNPIQKTSLLSLKRRDLGYFLIISRVGYVIPDFWNQYINRLNFSKAWPCNGFFARPGKLAARTEYPPHGQACSHARTGYPLHGHACFHGPGKHSPPVRPVRAQFA